MELNNVAFYVQRKGYELKLVAYVAEAENYGLSELQLEQIGRILFSQTDANVKPSDHIEGEYI